MVHDDRDRIGSRRLGRLSADIRDFCRNLQPGQAGERDRNLLDVVGHEADIALRHAGFHLDPRRVQKTQHGLLRQHVLEVLRENLGNRSVERCFEVRVAEIEPCGIQRAVNGFDLCLRSTDHHDLIIDIGLSDKVFCEKFLASVQLRLGIGQGCLKRRSLALKRSDPCNVWTGIESCHHVALLDFRADIDRAFDDFARYFETDIYLSHRAGASGVAVGYEALDISDYDRHYRADNGLDCLSGFFFASRDKKDRRSCQNDCRQPNSTKDRQVHFTKPHHI